MMRFYLPPLNPQAVSCRVFSALIAHLGKHVSKCTEGREEGKRVKGVEKHMCRFGSGLRGGTTSRVLRSVMLRICVVVITLDIISPLFVVTLRYIVKIKFPSWEVDRTGKLLRSLPLGRCNQRGSQSLYCSSWECAQGPSRLALYKTQHHTSVYWPPASLLRALIRLCSALVCGMFPPRCPS